VLVGLLDESHVHHALASKWLNAEGLDWGVCAVTEMGFLRLMTNPKLPYARSIEAAKIALVELGRHPGYRYWSTTDSWASLTEPFRERIFGHQQITDALLLGMAIREDSVLVTMDKAIRTMAGPQLARHVLLLQ
jgi:uncharacterized protein